ncbi:signal transduction histidine kinase [Kroppenstedtia sanguinis]|uniref:histidine kinase n=1 Tax=Kroppenstedtia sanguinis TaxID=1380684 RepID=A0ABW4CBC7_9BACL
MKLKWKIPFLFFLLAFVLFFVSVFYLRVEVIERIWERVSDRQQVHRESEAQMMNQVARLHPDIEKIHSYLQQRALREQLSVTLFQADGVTPLLKISSAQDGKTSEERWFPVRSQGKTVYLIQVIRPFREEEIGLEEALTDTFAFLMLLLSGLILLLALYFNMLIIRPLARLNQRLDQVNLENPMPPLTSKRCDEIGVLYRRFGEMEERLHHAHREQVDMVAAITHDLKTPLTSIRGFLELLLTRHDMSAGEKEYLQLIRKKEEQMNQLLNSFSEYTQKEIQLKDVELTQMPVSPLFRSVVEEYEAELFGLGHRLLCRNHLGLEQVRIHEGMLRRVFANIVSNSVRHGDRAQLTLTWTAFSEEGRVYFRLEDNGKGVSQGNLSELFQRFYTVDPSRGSGKGSGLGLATCRSIIHRHGGEIFAFSSSMGGLGISFSLPVVHQS